MSSPILKITKLDAAKRQLAEAIRLFFEQRDMVSVHALAAAAVNILNDLASHTGSARLVRDSDLIRPERKTEFLQLMNAAQNFFKHADRDPDAELDFRCGTTRYLILEAVLLLGSHSQPWLPETYVFFCWFGIASPHVLKDGALRNHVVACLADGVSPTDMDAWLEVLNGLRDQHVRGEWPPARGERKEP